MFTPVNRLIIAAGCALLVAVPASATFTDVAATAGTNLSGSKEGGLGWADLNGDGCLDQVAHTDNTTGRTRIYIGNCTTSPPTYTDATSTRADGMLDRTLGRSVAFGDLNNDGAVDIARTSGSRLEVYLNNNEGGGANTFGTGGGQDANIVFTSWSGRSFDAEGMAFADIDGDGNLDLLVENGGDGIVVLMGDGAGGLTQDDTTGLPDATAGGNGDYMTVGDYDLDGDIDVLARKSSEYDLYENLGDGTFVPVYGFNETASGSNKGGVALCDLDNDGDLDIFWTENDTNQIHRNDGGGLWTATNEPASSSGVTPGGTIDHVSCGDVDNDGDLDIYLGSGGQDYIYLNGGNLSFTRNNLGLSNTSNSEGAAFADIDNDGDLDLAVNNDNANNRLFENDQADGAGFEATCFAPRVDLGAGVSRVGYGATVQLFNATGTAQYGARQVHNGSGHGSGGDGGGEVHWGLGGAAGDQYIAQVVFPGGEAVRQCLRPSDQLSMGTCFVVYDTDADDTVDCTCGNGTLEAGEECDDGGRADGDGCDSNCLVEVGALPECSSGDDGTVTITAANTVVNTYYPPLAVETTLAAGSTTVALGAARGASATIAAGDTLLVIQTQGVEINNGAATNPGDPYGDGTGGNDRAGYLQTADARAGTYEYVTATGPAVAGVVPIAGAGTGGGLVNTYVNSRVVDASHGHRTFQIVRVPQYTNLEVDAGGSVTALEYNGATGGVVAVNVDGALTFDGGSVDASERGFRGGQGRTLGIDGSCGAGAPAYKGEGIAGTPALTYASLSGTLATQSSGYPTPTADGNGAPGNGGGNAFLGNDAGGGGGGNGGRGGRGGRGTGNACAQTSRGVGGAPSHGPFYFFPSPHNLVMGGGGGGAAGDDPIAGDEDFVSGQSGGGLVLIRARDIVVNSGAVRANGGGGGSAIAEGGGGGGAGGTIYIDSDAASLAGLVIEAHGGNGVDMQESQDGGGGGGGGGLVFIVGPTGANPDVSGGVGGDATSGNDYIGRGATGGQYSFPSNRSVGGACLFNDPPTAVADSASTNEDVAVTVTVLANDSEPDGQAMTTSVDTQATNGTAVRNGDNTITYTPNADFAGVDAFVYEVCDPLGACATATVTVTVNPQDDAVNAVADATSVNEDLDVTIDVMFNDSAPDGVGALSVSVLPSNGTATVDNGGTPADPTDDQILYDPAPNFFGIDSFTYQLCDTDGDCDTAVVTVDVVAQDDAVAAVADTTSVAEDGSVTVNVAANDSVPDGIGSITITGAAGNGTAAVNNGGTPGDASDDTVTYTPAPNVFGADAFTYQICDVDGDCDTATVSVTITPADDGVTANPDAPTVAEDGSVNVDVAANDSLPDGRGPLTITGAAGDGTATVNNGGTPGDPSDDTVTYVPAADFFGTDSFTYQICDADGDCDTATVTVTVTAQDDAVNAVADGATTNEDVAVTVAVLGNDSVPDGVGSVTVTVPPGNGSAAVNNGGTPGDASDDTVVYTPGANQSGPDMFTYQVCDVDGDCDTATVSVTVSPVDDPASATDDTATVAEDGGTTVSVLANDSVPDGIASLTIDVPAGNGTATVNDGGTPGDASDDTIDYTPFADFNGSDTVIYEVCDGDGDCDTAAVDITVTPVDDAVSAVDDPVTVAEDTPTTIDVAANDSLPDGLGSITITVPPVAGTATVDDGGTPGNPADDTVLFTPAADATGAVSFTYEVCDVDGDCDTATVSVTITPVDDAVTAFADGASTPVDTPVTVTVLGNDQVPDGVGSLTLDTAPSNGVAVIDDAGTPADPSDDTVTYTPGSGFIGNDSLVYEVCDLDGDCDTATVSIGVGLVNVPPTVVDDAATTLEDVAITVVVLGNDFDDNGDVLTVSQLVTPPASGTATINPNGTITYTPAPDQNGTVTFTYEACDPSLACATGIVSVTITPVPDGPVAADDAVATAADTGVNIDVRANDGDPDGDTLTAPTVLIAPANGTATVAGDGTVDYTPGAGFVGSDAFTYEVCDGTGRCDTAAVTVVVGGANQAPVAADDAATTDESVAVNIDVRANDTDPDGDPLTVATVTPAGQGAVVIEADQTLTYTPGPGASGADSFAYTVCDDQGLCDTATVTITLTDIDQSPLALDDEVSTELVAPVTVDVRANDSDPEGGALTSPTIVTPPVRGTAMVNGDGTITYTAEAAFEGTDIVVYEVCDPQNNCSTAQLVVNVVDPANTDPVIVDDAAATPVDTAVTVDVLANDSDADGDALDLRSVTGGGQGTITVNADGTVTYTPNAGFVGTDTFTYVACDPHDACGTGTVTVTVGMPNDPPQVTDDTFSVDEDGVLTANVLLNDSDPEGGALTITGITGGPTAGTATVNGDGTVTYTPAADWFGTDVFTYEVCDASGACAEGTVVVTVNPVQDAPDAQNDSVVTGQDTAVNIDVRANDTDVDGDEVLAPAITVEPENGSAVVEADGTVTYTPDAGFVGGDVFVYEVCDMSGLCDTGTVSVEVGGGNQAPVAVDDVANTTDGAAVNVAVLDNDSDPDGDPLSVTSVTNPVGGDVVVETDGTITFTPLGGFVGTETFVYTVCDDSGACDSAEVAVTVSPVDQAPVVVDDEVDTLVDISVNIDVLANDLEPDGHDLIGPAIVQAPAHGTVQVEGDGTVTYTPDAGFEGTDSFDYEVCDPQGNCGQATVTVHVVVPANEPPVAVDDVASTPVDTAVAIDVLANDTDPNGDVLGISQVQQPAHGTVSFESDGSLLYTPEAGYEGMDSFDYEVCDPYGQCDTAEVVVVVGAPIDSDMDGVPDENEDKNGNGVVDDGETDPQNPDTDGDGYCDGDAVVVGVCEQGGEDLDGDGEVDPGESDPLDPCDPDDNTPACLAYDGDGDGVPDVNEDKNGNGVVDDGETDPNNPDTDGDGYCDGDAVILGVCEKGGEDLDGNGEVDPGESDPRDPCDPDPQADACLNQTDTDGDGIPDAVEDQNGNGVVDDDETDPNDPDTDGDGLCDGSGAVAGVCDSGEDANNDGDVDVGESDPLDPCDPNPEADACIDPTDTDGDGVPDELEDRNGNGVVDEGETDPEDADTDGDGYCDGANTVEDVCIGGEDLDNDGVFEAGESDPLDPCDPDATAQACRDKDGDGWDDDFEVTGGGVLTCSHTGGTGTGAPGYALLVLGLGALVAVRRRRRG